MMRAVLSLRLRRRSYEDIAKQLQPTVRQVEHPGSFIAFLETISGARVADDGHGGHIVTLDTPEGHE